MNIKQIFPSFSFLDINIPDEYKCIVMSDEYNAEVLEKLFQNISDKNSFYIKESGYICQYENWKFDELFLETNVLLFNINNSIFCFCQPVEGFYVFIFEMKNSSLLKPLINQNDYIENINADIDYLRQVGGREDYIKKIENLIIKMCN